MRHARRAMRRAFPILLLAFASSASAQQPNAAEKAAAETLFDEGKRLVQLGQYAEACTKFEESQRLDAGVGTLIYLADCYERSGRLASAWVTFREAAAAARAAGQEREKLARERAARLEPQLARIVITVPDSARVAGLDVRRNGMPVSTPLWGSPVPVDAGTHTIEAAAPQRKPWRQAIEVADGSPPITIEVPPLELVPLSGSAPSGPAQDRDPDPPPPAADQAGDGGGQRLAGVIVGGIGLAAIGVGINFWLQGSAKHDDALERCAPVCDDRARELQDDAERDTTIGNVAVIGGAALIAGGIVLVLTAPSGKSEAWVRANPVGRSLQIGASF
jgi:tetratricopeptide (TPR) repeat protein